MMFIRPQDCFEFISSLEDESVSLLLTDPPYMGIVSDSWDNQWKTDKEYVSWMHTLFSIAKPKLKPDGSIIFFGGIGKHGERPFYRLMFALEESNLYTFRNQITWKKRKAYGKEFDYLFCREEIAWYSTSQERTKVIFNIPLLDVKRGYDGWNKKYKAKSEYKRVSNVWDDIPELMRTERKTQKPIPLMERLIQTHSNPGDLVIDPFSGWGTTGVAALNLGRKFLGSERILEDAVKANMRCEDAALRYKTSLSPKT